MRGGKLAQNPKSEAAKSEYPKGARPSMNRSAGLQPAYDSHQGCGVQIKEEVNLGANTQSRSQTGAPPGWRKMRAWRNIWHRFAMQLWDIAMQLWDIL
jgi:hypothetical protein